MNLILLRRCREDPWREEVVVIRDYAGIPNLEGLGSQQGQDSVLQVIGQCSVCLHLLICIRKRYFVNKHRPSFDPYVNEAL